MSNETEPGFLAPYDFERSVGYWVVVTAHMFQRALNEELMPRGVTYRQWQVLAWLAIEGPLAQNELAERMNIEPATLVSVLGRMERDGLVLRGEDPADRRRRVVRPTRKAEPMWSAGVECASRVRERSIQGLSADERDTAIRLLQAMRENLLAELASPEPEAA